MESDEYLKVRVDETKIKFYKVKKVNKCDIIIGKNTANIYLKPFKQDIHISYPTNSTTKLNL